MDQRRTRPAAAAATIFCVLSCRELTTLALMATRSTTLFRYSLVQIRCQPVESFILFKPTGHLHFTPSSDIITNYNGTGNGTLLCDNNNDFISIAFFPLTHAHMCWTNTDAKMYTTRILNTRSKNNTYVHTTFLKNLKIYKSYAKVSNHIQF